MIRKRQQKVKRRHFCLLVNPQAADYERHLIRRLTSAIRKSGCYYTVLEPNSAIELFTLARQATGARKLSRFLGQHVSRRGKITALVACGGDGTFNLVARSAMETGVPVGILPMGRMNNIARAIHDSVDPDVAIKKILSGRYRRIDSARAANQVFFGSVGVGFTAELARAQIGKRTPRFGLGWSQLGSRAAAEVAVTSIVLKVDSFRFEVSPLIFNVNLLPYSAGLPLSLASIPDDGRAEVIFDLGNKAGEFGSFTRSIYKGKYLYGNDVRLYRGKTITCQPIKGKTLYLDGELIELPANVLEIQVGPGQVNVFC